YPAAQRRLRRRVFPTRRSSDLVRHAVGSYSNGTEAQSRSANLDLLKAFICVDGKVWQNSSVPDANSFRLQDLAKTRDPRFEATLDRKSTRLNSSHVKISYAVFC